MKHKESNPTLTDWKTITRAFKTIRYNFPVNNEYYTSLIHSPTMRKYYPVPSEDVARFTATQKTSLRDKNLIAVLEELGMTEINLDNNIGVMNGEKNARKLGRVLTQSGLTKYSELLKKRNNSAARNGSEYSIVISAHPVDVLTASFNRNWTSCMRISHGGTHTLPREMCRKENFAMVAYLIKSNDKSIKSPLGRLFLNGYSPNIVPEDSYYRTNTRDTINFFGGIYSFKRDLVGKTLPAVFNMSTSTYGKFPTPFKYKLSEVLKNEVNSQLNSSKLPTKYNSTTFYVDLNPSQISSLNLTARPKTVIVPSKTVNKSKSKRNLIADDVLFGGVVWDSKIHSYSSYSPHLSNVFSLVNPPRKEYRDRYPSAPEKASNILYNRNTNDVLIYLKGSNLRFYQIKRILEIRPNLLRKEEINKYISNMGPEFKLLVKNKTPVSKPRKKKNDEKV